MAIKHKALLAPLYWGSINSTILQLIIVFYLPHVIAPTEYKHEFYEALRRKAAQGMIQCFSLSTQCLLELVLVFCWSDDM
jgi:hypothetical protein